MRCTTKRSIILGFRHPPRLRRASSVASVALEMRFGRVLPRWIKRPLTAWLDRVGMVLSPEWCRTALLGRVVFHTTWCVTRDQAVVHVTKPSYQPTRSTCIIQSCWRRGRAPTSLEGNLWEVVIFTLGGCPGSRARLTDARTHVAWGVHGRKPARTRRSSAGTTLLTTFFCMAFVLVDHPFWVRVSSVGTSLRPR